MKPFYFVLACFCTAGLIGLVAPGCGSPQTGTKVVVTIPETGKVQTVAGVTEITHDGCTFLFFTNQHGQPSGVVHSPKCRGCAK